MENTVDNINEFSDRNKGKILAFNAIVTIALFVFLLNKLENDGAADKRPKHA